MVFQSKVILLALALLILAFSIKNVDFIFFFIEFGIKLTNIVHPICLPYSSNSKERKDREVTVLGFATDGLSRSTSTTLKAAKMLVFSKAECNDNLQKELANSKECKSILLDFSVYIISKKDSSFEAFSLKKTIC